MTGVERERPGRVPSSPPLTPPASSLLLEALTVEWAAAALARGEATGVELTGRALARIEALDSAGPELRAVISLVPTALDQARAADARRRAGRPLGPLDGVPVVVKDCIETGHAPTSHGSALFAGWRAPGDAAVVARLRAGGMVVVAKTSLDDFAAATVGRSSLRGLMRNPHDPTRTVGGSSGGSAVAVAVGYAALALGTDTGGSLRIPAAACGVVAIRPTPGLVPTAGVFPRSFDQDTVGPMATTVRGAALGLAALVAGRSAIGRIVAAEVTVAAVGGLRPGGAADPGGAVGVADPVGAVGAADLGGAADLTDLTGVRVAVVRGGLAIWGDDPAGPVARQFDAMLDVLRGLGAVPVEFDPPPRPLLEESALTTWQSARAVDQYLRTRPDAPVRSFAELCASGRYTDAARAAFERELAAARAADGDERIRRARARRAELLGWTGTQWARARVGLAVYPTAQRPAGPVGREQDGVYTRWSEHAGLPALAMPMGWASGLPVSAEFVALPHREATLVRVGLALEAALAASVR